MPMSIASKIIDGKMGGTSAAASLLNIGVSTVDSWKRRNSIPAKWQQKIVDATRESQKPVVYEDFFRRERR